MRDAKGIAWTHVFRWWDDEYGKAEVFQKSCTFVQEMTLPPPKITLI